MILAAVCFSGCSGQKETASKEQGTSVSEEKGSTDVYNWKEMKPERSLELKYATQFAVDYYEGGYALISITEGGKYLVVPENIVAEYGIAALHPKGTAVTGGYIVFEKAV